MAANLAKDATGLVNRVFKGMASDTAKGKAFVVSGNKSAMNATKAIRQKKLPVAPKGKYSATTNKNKLLKNGNVMLSKGTSKNISTVKSKQDHVYGFGNLVGGGIGRTYNNVANKKMNFGDGIKAAHSVSDGKGGTRLSKSAMAGTFVGASAVGRVATGGGVMKDKNGNTNLIGIPFI